MFTPNVIVSDYINQFPSEIAGRLAQLRSIIHACLPNEAEEYIGYKMPAYKLHGTLFYFAAYKNHIGFYPTSDAILHFENKLQDYTYSKGAIQFSHKAKLPIALIKQMIRYRINQNLKK